MGVGYQTFWFMNERRAAATRDGLRRGALTRSVRPTHGHAGVAAAGLLCRQWRTYSTEASGTACTVTVRME
jgi:hypothetical protein